MPGMNKSFSGTRAGDIGAAIRYPGDHGDPAKIQSEKILDKSLDVSDSPYLQFYTVSVLIRRRMCA